MLKKIIKNALRLLLPKRLASLLKTLENIDCQEINNLLQLTHKNIARGKWEALRGNGKKKILVVGYFTTRMHHSLYIYLRDFFINSLFDAAAIDLTPADKVKSAIINEYLPYPNYREKKAYGYLPSLDENLILDAVSAQKHLSKSEDAVAAMSVLYIFVEDILNFYKPDLVIMWGFYMPVSRIFRALCKKRRIPAAAAEYGVLPGTVSFDFAGHMATSWAAGTYFNSLPVDKQDLDNAKKYLSIGADVKYSRNNLPPAPPQRNARLKSLRASGKKTILYIGCNSSDSGNSSYEEQAASFHSPFFKDDAEVYPYLRELCGKHTDWHILYRPHPLTKADTLDFDLGCTTVINDGNLYESLDLADCAITILSQGAYVSLLKGVPIILLGRLQLNNSGAAYLLNQKNELEHIIAKALSDGFTEEQREKFTEHTARILKYYSYKAYPDIPTARDMARFSRDLLSVLEGNASEHLKYEREAYLKQRAIDD